MGISLYFGLPGAGKTTLLCKMMKKALKGKTYDHVYSNIDVNIDGYYKIERGDLGKYDLHNGLILWDESMIDFDSRDFKNFSNRLVEFFMKHRHAELDICLFSQGWDCIDRKIRIITDRVYYLYKPPLFGLWFSHYYRIPYDIIIPDPKKSDSEKLGEIIQGYCKPPILQRIFCPRVYRPRWYKYFDSWERPELPALPKDRWRGSLSLNNNPAGQDDESQDSSCVAVERDSSYDSNSKSRERDTLDKVAT